MDASLNAQAQALLATLAAQCSAGRGLGSMSASVYDAAWLSMVRKPGSGTGTGTDIGTSTWLFPECFEFVLAQQLPSGAWMSYATPIDGILNTAAALLALKRRMQAQADDDWLARSRRAETALKQMLHGWDMDSADQVGFEILLTALLHLLEQEGVFIDFPQLGALRAVRDAKLAKLPPSTLYLTPSTLYHSLEAFIGHIDFDRVRRWREANGSMMSSPSSTAAYLMNSTTWDDEAEAYLRNVLDQVSGHLGRGAVPCAWPTTVFEVSWVVSAFVAAGVPIGAAETSAFASLLQETLAAQKGLLGFSPGSFPDADDTAKGLEALHHLSPGNNASADSLIQTYEAGEHFITYPGERNASFSANCNVLVLLLTRDDRAEHVPQIAKAVQFLTALVFGGNVKEKWHLSELYWTMLLSRAFALLFKHEEIVLRVFDLAPNLRSEIPMISLHMLMRVLRTQQKDGSWDHVCEVTSYGVLALASLAKLPWVRQLDKGRIVAAMALGKSFLHANRSDWAKGRYLWIEKVTYSADVLSEAYCLAAAFVPMPSTIQAEAEIGASGRAFLMADQLLLGMKKTGNLLARTPLVSGTEPYALRAAEMQACFAMQALQRRSPAIFPRTAKGKDKYLFIIPLALTVSAELHGCPVSLSVMYEMMVLSVLNFHVDEYMEGLVEAHFGERLDDIRALVQQLFVDLRANTSGTNSTNSTNGHEEKNVRRDDNAAKDQPTTEDVRTVLHKYVTHVLHHPAVLSSPGSFQAQLAAELQTFLLAHITHARDNIRMRAQWVPDGNGSSSSSETSLSRETGNDDTNETSNGNGITTHTSSSRASPSPPRHQYRAPGRTFYNWVRSTSADHTSCPFSFVFFNCLVSSSQQQPNSHGSVVGILGSARTAYLAEDACRHLASLCRMYNDLGSVARDADERALNSVNFPEFFLSSSSSSFSSGTQDDDADNGAKTELLWIAEYERRGLNIAMEMLEMELGGRGGRNGGLVGALRMFVDLTDLYGQIYVLEDVGTRTR